MKFDRNRDLREAIRFLECLSQDGMNLAEDLLKRQSVDVNPLVEYRNRWLDLMRDKANRDLSAEVKKMREKLIREIERMIGV
ncbi:MAG: hypothetical protein AAGB46_07760 [Verrucomicrobiota bacterium]